MKKLTVGSCFSGIGGIEKGLEDTGGFETKWQIEIDPYASAVLKKHWPDVVRYSDIRSINGADLEKVDLICGGYPCQPFSLAGKRAGETDTRHLWPDMFRIIRDLRPRFCLLENVPGHLSMGFGRVLGDLAECGYDAEWQMLSAAGVGAPHLRRRVFILAHAMRSSGSTEPGEQQSQRAEIIDASRQENVADTARQRAGTVSTRSRSKGKRAADVDGRRERIRDSASARLPNGRAQTLGRSEPLAQSQRSNWWAVEPDMGRVAHGVPARMDRLKCLGNSVVPQVAQKIGEMILEFENTLLT